ncbi:MAG TPA: glycosyl hydrolase family 28 protein, partial [Syntrophorhabdaceae bacterium]
MGGEWADLFSYDAVVDRVTQSHMSFVYFDSDFSKKVEVRVTRNSGSITSAQVRPASAGITPTVSGNTITFTMTKPKKISVEVDGNILNNLFVFANRKETGAIKGPRTGVHYFGPGTHFIGDGTGTLYLTSGEKAYIAGGAILYGNIFILDAKNVSVSGRGILSGRLFDHALPDNLPKPPMIFMDGSSGVTVKDIIILDTVGWNISIAASDSVTLDNLKIVGWTINSDGINPQYSRNVRINDCLIRSNDDCISVKLA